MNKYRIKVRNRLIAKITFSLVLLVIAAIIVIYSDINSILKSAQVGGLIGGAFGMLVFLYKDIGALRSEEKLQQLRIVEYDERTNLIITKAAKTTFLMLGYILTIAMIVSISFNVVVAITIWVLLVTIYAIYFISYLYFSKSV